MPDAYGAQYSADDALKRADGAVVDAGVRVFENVFNCADVALNGVQADLIAAQLPAGCKVRAIKIHASVNLSAINITAGITGTVAKYATSIAAPNATTRELVVVSTALDNEPLDAPETLRIFPSTTWPSSGIIITEVFVSKR